MGISSYTRIKLFSLSSKVSGWRRLVGGGGGPEISCAIETNETVTNIKYVAPSAAELELYYVDVMMKVRLWSCQLVG